MKCIIRCYWKYIIRLNSNIIVIIIFQTRQITTHVNKLCSVNVYLSNSIGRNVKYRNTHKHSLHLDHESHSFISYILPRLNMYKFMTMKMNERSGIHFCEAFNISQSLARKEWQERDGRKKCFKKCFQEAQMRKMIKKDF